MVDQLLDYPDTAAMLMALKPDEPVYALRLHEVRKAAENFTRAFPGDVLYAVKANPQPDVLRALHAGGIQHFDVASLKEAQLIKELFPAANSYFMHPVKSVHAIREASQNLDISYFVVDHPDELAKVLIHTMPRKPVIMIRLSMPRNMAVYDLGGKFGCSTAEAVALARAASSEGLAVGFSFHVGSQCLDPDAYIRALALVGDVIRSANIHPDTIDVGGGFPAAYRNVTLPPLGDYVGAILEGMAKIRLAFPTRLMAEPGRSLAAPSASLIVKVELRRGNKLYLNDGMSGGLSELRFAGIDVPMRVWRVNGNAKIVTTSLDEFHLCGPTCDSADVIEGPFALAADIQSGDYIEFGQMGAYSISMRSDFNGFQNAPVVSVNDSAFLP